MRKFDHQTEINNDKALDIISNLTNIGLDNAHKLTNLQLKISKENVQQAADTINFLTKKSTPQQLLESVNQLVTIKMKSSNDYCSELISIVNNTNVKLIQTSIKSFELFKNFNMYNISNWLNSTQDENPTIRGIFDATANLTNKMLDNSKDITTKVTESAYENMDSMDEISSEDTKATRKSLDLTANNTNKDAKTAPDKHATPKVNATAHKQSNEKLASKKAETVTKAKDNELVK